MKKSLLFYILISAIILSACSSSVRFAGIEENILQIEGFASYYADHFQGKKTSSGEIFDQSKLTAAHKTIPFGTKVLVENVNNGKTVVVVINDRGPFVKGRIIDLSRAAAEKLDMIHDGVVPVVITILE